MTESQQGRDPTAGPPGDVLARLGLDVARAAAQLVSARAVGGVQVAATKSNAVDVVTAADRECEALVRQRLAAQRPHDALLGEEGTLRPGTSGVRWIIDPIDGTVNYLYGIAQYAVSIAAEVAGVVVAGVVINAATGTEYVAWLNPDGTAVATRDGTSLSPRGPAPLAERLIGTGFNYDSGLRRHQAEAMVRLLPQIRDIRRLGSCALDLCHVAEGTLDGYVEEGVNLWDYAAGALVARAAGARTEVTTGATGRELILCAPAHGFDEFRVAVSGAGFLAEPSLGAGE